MGDGVSEKRFINNKRRMMNLCAGELSTKAIEVK